MLQLRGLKQVLLEGSDVTRTELQLGCYLFHQCPRGLAVSGSDELSNGAVEAGRYISKEDESG